MWDSPTVLLRYALSFLYNIKLVKNYTKIFEITQDMSSPAKIYPKLKSFTQALLVMLVTNITSDLRWKSVPMHIIKPEKWTHSGGEKVYVKCLGQPYLYRSPHYGTGSYLFINQHCHSDCYWQMFSVRRKKEWKFNEYLGIQSQNSKIYFV